MWGSVPSMRIRKGIWKDSRGGNTREELIHPGFLLGVEGRRESGSNIRSDFSPSSSTSRSRTGSGLTRGLECVQI